MSQAIEVSESGIEYSANRDDRGFGEERGLASIILSEYPYCVDDPFQNDFVPMELDELKGLSNAILSRKAGKKSLTRKEEIYTFRSMHYYRSRATEAAKNVEAGAGGVELDVSNMQEAHERAVAFRDALIEVNIGLMYMSNQFAKAFSRDMDSDYEDGWRQRARDRWEMLRSVACKTLIDAVDTFDYRKGFRFSSYFSGSVDQEYKNHRRNLKWGANHFQIEHNEEEGAVREPRISDCELLLEQIRNVIRKNLAHLTPLEMVAVSDMHGINGEVRTCGEIGDMVGCGKANVSRANRNAIKKIRAVLAA